MLTDLTVLVAGGQAFTVSGVDLLRLLWQVEQGLHNRSLDPPSEGTGAEASPFVMSTANQWRHAARQAAEHQAAETYYRVGGIELRKLRGGFITWKGLDKGPTYREFALMANDLVQQGETDAGIAKMIRDVLKDEPPPLPPEADPVPGRAYAFRVVPLLAAVLFVGEPARNPRSFALNLMHLDLMQARRTYGLKGKLFQLSKILWHPENLTLESNTSDAPPAKPQTGMGGSPVKRVADLHRVGGKGPMTHTDAAAQAKATLSKGPSPALTYEAEKERNVLIHWLDALPYAWYGVRPNWQRHEPVAVTKVLAPEREKFRKGEEELKGRLELIKRLVTERFLTLDSMVYPLG